MAYIWGYGLMVIRSLLLSFQNKPLARRIFSVPATASFCVGDCREERPGAVLREAESRRMLWSKPDVPRTLPEGSARGDMVSASLQMARLWNRVMMRLFKKKLCLVYPAL